MRIYSKPILLALITALFSCSSDDDGSISTFPISFTFTHTVVNQTLELNELMYQNMAGNIYSVEKLQYIISNIILHREDGGSFELEGYHFVDISDNGTLTWDSPLEIMAGEYTGISFTFGLDQELNITGAYKELNALSWSWPEMLGGGYHFMKLEGRFIDNNTTTSSFATHFGTARELTATDPVFHANHIDVSLNTNFDVDHTMKIILTMDINKWYETPNTWDLNVMPGPIMMNYDAQKMLQANGADVFSVTSLSVN